MTFDQLFDRISDDDIRIKGHRIGIDDVLTYFIDGYSAEEIQAQLPTLSLKEIYATITYYLYNRTEVDAYLARLESWRERRYAAWQADPSPLVEQLRQRKQEQQALADAA